MHKKINIFNIPVDCLTMEETINVIDSAIKEKRHINHTVVNAGKIVLMQKDKNLYNSVTTCDMINADGQSVVWASKILNQPLPERVNGTNLMENLVYLAYKKNYKIFFFGAKEEIVTKVVDKYSKKYSSKIIAGYKNGYFHSDEEAEIAQLIADSKTNILFVAITSPIKENFLYKYREILKSVNFTMGVGGSFDVISGKIKRAPVWAQNSGLEWIYRLIQEPKRMWKRYLIGNLIFIYLIFKEKFRQKNNQRPFVV